MLIKDNKEDIIKEISVNVEFSFKAVEPYLKNEGTDFIKDVVGVVLYKELDSNYDGDVNNLSNKYKVLLPLVQRPLVYFGYLKYLPFGDVQVTDGGINVKKSETSIPASAKRVQNLKDALSETAYNSLEKLIRFLWANASKYSWKSTKGYNKYLQHFINFSDDFNSWTQTSFSFEVFSNLKSSTRFAEQTYLKPILHDDLFNKLKEEVKTNAFSDEEVYDFEESGSSSASGSIPVYDNISNHKKLMELIKPALANLTMAHGLSNKRIDISTTGLNEMFTSGFSSENIKGGNPVRNEVFRSVVEQFRHDGEMYLKLLKDYLIENAEDFPLYKSDESYDETEVADDDLFENDVEGKSFSFY